MSRRTRVATGIYSDKYGLAATVKVGRLQRERRFPVATSPAFMQNWRDRARADLREDSTHEDHPAPRGTFAGDLPRYLTRIQGRPSFKSDRSHLRAWLPHVGQMARHTIRPEQVAQAFARWQAAGRSPRTIRHRRRVLRELYQALDGPHARPPIVGVKTPRPSAPIPIAVSRATIRAVAKSLKAGRDSAKGYARFLIRALTGQRPSQIMRATREDVDLQRRIWFVRPAKGGTAIPLPLSPAMMRAWRVFIKAGAWGPFDTRSFSHLLHRHGWPKGVRPYALRHTFAIDLLLHGVDLGEVQGLLGHRQIETTRQHYAPILVARLRRAVEKRAFAL